MTTTDVRGAEIADYLSAVRAALGDLDPATRDGLLEDLPEHLGEVVATDPEPLPARLGPPSVFAAELRSAAGLPEPAAAPPHPTAGTTSSIDLIRSMLTTGDRSIGRMLGYDRSWAFLADLQPAWWIARGVIVGFLTLAFFANFVISPVVGIIAVILSVRLGRRAKIATTPGPRVASLIFSAACTLIVLLVVSAAITDR